VKLMVVLLVSANSLSRRWLSQVKPRNTSSKPSEDASRR
jgi:hypothetical protein